MQSVHEALRGQTSRRGLFQLAAAGGGAALLASRAGQALGQDKVELEFWTPGGSGPFCQGFETIAQNYETLHPNVNIGETQCGTGEQNFNEVLLARIAAGNPPDATVLWTSPAALAVRSALEPLDALMATSQYSQLENWPAAVLASCQWEGQTYGLPATAGTYAAIYNQELFESKGIPSDRASFPKTWDELRQLSKEFTVWNGDTLDSMGVVPRPADAVEFAVLSACNGSQLYDTANQKYTIDSAQNVELMDFFVAWLDEEYRGDYQKVLESGNWSEIIVDGKPPAFQEGKLAVVRTGFWITGEFYAHTEPKFERWDAARFPIGPSGTESKSGYWPNWLVVPKGTDNAAEAFSYLDYIGGEGIKVWFNNIPDLPTNSKVPLLVPQVAVDKRGEEFGKDITEFFRSQLEIATPMWTSPVVDFANDQVFRAIEQIMYKRSSPKDALGQAQRASQAELERVLASAG
ncbi:MAG: multiple sugar transport system substrate-binding protein [Thermomicrobiales bacterium]|jgi:ABC-type glycerol-3-phosphate transport system substrate-binding protein|nr:multiple sugar transport system substrate-binding protein [Thermomicrobiales bacterium]